MQPAILGLQEVVPGQKANLEKALPGYDFLGVARDDGRAKGEFSNLAIRRDIFRVRSSGTFWLSPTPGVPSKGWDAAYPRIATSAKLVRRSDGRRLLALNTHFDHVGETARLQSARQIAAWLSAQRTPGGDIIMTGDLNAEPETPPIRELTTIHAGPAGRSRSLADTTHRTRRDLQQFRDGPKREPPHRLYPRQALRSRSRTTPCSHGRAKAGGPRRTISP